MQGEQSQKEPNEMTISFFGRCVVGIAAGLGVVIGTIKSMRDIAEHLNGWHVLLGLSLLVLIALGIDACRQWMEKQFAVVGTNLQSEAITRANAIDSLSQQSTEAIRRVEDSIRALKPASDKQTVALPERIKTFTKELTAYLSNRTARPDEEEIWQKYGSPSSEISSGSQFAAKYNDTIQLWDDRLAAGYWLEYAEKAAALRHELVLRCGADTELDQLVSGLEGPVKGEHHVLMQKLVQRFRLLASKLD
jgi:hypothetical protein